MMRCQEFRTVDELADAVIAHAMRYRTSPPIDRVFDVRSRLLCMGRVQLHALLVADEQGKSNVIAPQILRDLGYACAAVERAAA